MTKEEILDNYHNLSNKYKVEVLEIALSYMQQYNARTIKDCIILGMTDRFPKYSLEKTH